VTPHIQGSEPVGKKKKKNGNNLTFNRKTNKIKIKLKCSEQKRLVEKTINRFKFGSQSIMNSNSIAYANVAWTHPK